MNNEKLIALVSKFQYLYNSNHAKYTDTVLKDKTWREIASQLRQPGKCISRSSYVLFLRLIEC